MATTPQFVPGDVVSDFDFPQREAAFFYGYFSVDIPRKLPCDIEVPSAVLASGTAKPHAIRRSATFSPAGGIRRHVLAIFRHLVGHDGQPQRSSN